MRFLTFLNCVQIIVGMIRFPCGVFWEWLFFFVEFCEVFMFMKTFVRRKLMGNVSVEIVMNIKM